MVVVLIVLLRLGHGSALSDVDEQYTYVQRQENIGRGPTEWLAQSGSWKHHVSQHIRSPVRLIFYPDKNIALLILSLTPFPLDTAIAVSKGDHAWVGTLREKRAIRIRSRNFDPPFLVDQIPQRAIRSRNWAINTSGNVKQDQIRQLGSSTSAQTRLWRENYMLVLRAVALFMNDLCIWHFRLKRWINARSDSSGNATCGLIALAPFLRDHDPAFSEQVGTRSLSYSLQHEMYLEEYFLLARWSGAKYGVSRWWLLGSP